MQDGDLLKILSRSRSWNAGHGITGMLLYLEGRFLSQNEGRFMQVLEGTEHQVKDIFEQIKNDERHHGLIVLKQSTAPQRNFNNWSMGFNSLGLDAYKSLPGFFDLNDEFLKSDALQHSNLPLHFLKSFYETSLSDDHNH